MIPVVVSATPTDGYRLLLVFQDGTRGEIDISKVISFTGVFESLRNLSAFRRVRVDAESGTVAWPNGADLDPVVLYASVRGVDVSDLLGTTRRT